MTLSVGERLGPYEVIAPLGAGGMGEVYKARDTRLGRSVAIKVLPAATASSAEHRQRFAREARAIAALNHPNICTLHDVGHSGDVDYLVMELVEGETLADRLKRGPLPTSDVVRIGTEIARALARAHRVGVLHRDLKPANVMLTKTGVKLMDFGLARIARLDGLMGGSQMPTEGTPLTGEGYLVGTIHYMAPEQLEGHEADARSDVWSLGATLYEMATGRRAFEGSSTASVISAIMREEPRSIAELSPMSPPALDRLVRTCLAKDPDARWQSAADVARALEWVGEADRPAEQSSRGLRGGAWRWLSPFALVLAAASTAIALRLWRIKVEESGRVTRSSIAIPHSTDPYITGGSIALAPDGSAIAVTLADSAGTGQLFVRRLDGFESVLLETPHGAHLPFWSPDSREIGYLTDENKLERMPATGGPEQIICVIPWKKFRCASWGKHGDVVFSTGAEHEAIYRVRDAGGTPVVIAAPDTAKGELSYNNPWFLPDAEHFVFAVVSERLFPKFSIRVGSLHGGKVHELLIADSAPRVAPDGTMFFVQDRVLVAQRTSSDGARLLGPRLVLADEPQRRTNYSLAEPGACASTNELAYVPRDRGQTRLEWYARDGTPLSEVARLNDPLTFPAISPDGTRAILHYENGVETNLWLLDFHTGVPVQITSPNGIGRFPVWFPDNRRIVFNVMGPQGIGMAVQDVDDPASFHVVVSAGYMATPTDMLSGSGPVLLHLSVHGSHDVVVAYPDSGWKCLPYAATSHEELNPHFLAGGRYIAFEADYHGREQIFADTYPTRTHLVALTTEPVLGWTLHVRGNEVIYVSGNDQRVRSLLVTPSGSSLSVGRPTTLFTLPADARGFAVSADGKRFLVASPAGVAQAPSITLVHNWRAALRKQN